MHQVALEQISVRQKMIELLDFLHAQKMASLQSLVGQATSRAQKIGTFLAVLELVRMRLVDLMGEARAWTLVPSTIAGEAMASYEEDFR